MRGAAFARTAGWEKKEQMEQEGETNNGQKESIKITHR